MINTFRNPYGPVAQRIGAARYEREGIQVRILVGLPKLRYSMKKCDNCEKLKREIAKLKQELEQAKSDLQFEISRYLPS